MHPPSLGKQGEGRHAAHLSGSLARWDMHGPPCVSSEQLTKASLAAPLSAVTVPPQMAWCDGKW